MNFSQPAWLVLLVLPPLLGVAAVLIARLRGRQWQEFIAPRLRGALLKRSTPLPHWFSLIFLLGAIAAMIAAMARPQGEAGSRTEKAVGRNVLLVLDISRSMRVADVNPDRLARAKTTILELLEGLPNERIGLIGFAGSAYSYAPLTVDHNAVREVVEQIDETWATRGGSNLAAALRLAIDTLKATGQRNNALIILSDGEKHDRMHDDLIDEARQAGVYIMAIGVGTEDGDYVPNPDFPEGRMVDRSGQPVISRLQPEILQRLAVETRGRYAVAASGVDLTSMVQDVIKDLDTFEIEGRERAVAVEFYQWLLLPAILFLIVSVVSGTRWRAVRAALLAAGCFMTMESAMADGVSAAKETLRQGDYESARAAYRDLAEKTQLRERRARFRLGEATAAWHSGDFRGSRSAYSQALLSENPEVLRNAHLGLGKSLFQLGWLALDDGRYPADPADTPAIEDFDELVRGKLDDIVSGDNAAETGLKPIENLITNWADAVRHFDSASPEPSAAHNRKVAMTYLDRLRDLLEEDRQQTEDSLPEPEEGEGQPQPGESDSGEDSEPSDQEGEDDGQEPRDPGGEGERSADPQEGEGDDPEKSDDNSGKQDEEEDDSGSDPIDPDETPEDRARRILQENADLEKGPPVPGRHEFIPPEKDW